MRPWPKQGPDRRLVPLLALLVLAGCDGLFDVENPTNLLDEDLTRPQLVQTLSNSAEGNLAGPFGSVVLYGGMLADEVFHPSSQDFAILIVQGDRRSDNVQVHTMYNDLAAARWIADSMVERLEELVDDPSSHLGVARSYFFGGIARMAMADHYEEVTYDGGAPVTPAQAIEHAIERFEQAARIAGAGGDRNLQAAALGSIARARRSLYFENLHAGAGVDAGQFQQAEAAAREALALDDRYRIDFRYGSPGGSNALFTGLTEAGGGRYHRMDEAYAYLPDPVTGDPDPRIRHSPLAGSGPRGEEIYYQTKYSAFEDPIPAARAAEARLVIAEARLLAGDLGEAVTWINQVRAETPGLASFTSADAAEIREQLLHERRAELWLEGRRWADHRYYEIIPMRWAASSVARGVHERWPVSDQERNNNENYAGG